MIELLFYNCYLTTSGFIKLLFKTHPTELFIYWHYVIVRWRTNMLLSRQPVEETTRYYRSLLVDNKIIDRTTQAI